MKQRLWVVCCKFGNGTFGIADFVNETDYKRQYAFTNYSDAHKMKKIMQDQLTAWKNKKDIFVREFKSLGAL